VAFSRRLQEIREGFQPAFWVANITELFERLSYYGVNAVLAIYLHETLKFSQQQTGELIGFFGGVVWFLIWLFGKERVRDFLSKILSH
jgi:dipeptide/tripeptide permease